MREPRAARRWWCRSSRSTATRGAAGVPTSPPPRRPEHAEPLFEAFCAALARAGVPVARGVFRAHMAVELVNDGPVTLLIESPAAGTLSGGAKP